MSYLPLPQSATLITRYPVGNGAQYEVQGPNGRPNDPTDTPNFIAFLAELRCQAPDKIISVAVPARTEDMLAYTAASIPQMEPSIDFWNVMTYDYINRRDTKTGYHAGGQVVDETIAAYQARKMTMSMMNIGYPMYAKWFELGASSTCTEAQPIGCTMPQYETSDGGDNGQSGAWMLYQPLNAVNQTGMDPTLQETLTQSWARLSAAANTDNTQAGGSAWYDTTDSVNIFWTWVTGNDVAQSCSKWKGQVGGFMAWSIDQDNNGAAGGDRFDALRACST